MFTIVMKTLFLVLCPQHSPFFAEQLTAFQVWLTMGVENRNPPEQLPIVLQVHTHIHARKTHMHKYAMVLIT